MNITSKLEKLNQTKWKTVRNFYVDGILVCSYYTGNDFFAARTSNLRNVKKTCRKTIWNSVGLSKVLNKNITVGSTYRSGNSVFYDDVPDNSYTGTVTTTKTIEKLLNKL